MQPEEEAWIERSLCDSDRARCTSRVLSIRKEDVVAKGDNYTSDLFRLHVKVLLNSGEVEERSVIYKVLPSTEARQKHMRESGIFVIEKRMYTDVLPLMAKLRREKEGNVEPLWTECYASMGYEALLLEDLRVKGYTMGNRLQGLDWDHCKLVLRSLAKFHALGAVLRQRGQIVLQDYDKYFLQRNMTIMGLFHKLAFEGLSKLIADKFEDEWKPYAEKIKKKAETLPNDLLNILALDKAKFNTLNHGDCWVNNMLFKYNSDGKPISTRLIDFQIVFYNHVGFDLQYFLGTSPEIEVRPRIPELIRIYHESLEENLKTYGFTAQIPTIDDIFNYYREAALFGLTSAISLLQLMKMHAKEVPDLEMLMKEYENKKEAMPSGFFSPSQEYIDAIKHNLKEAEDFGVFDTT